MSIFHDDFDSEVGTGDGTSGGSGLSYTGFANWTVSDGTVDLLQDGDYGVSCAGAGKCVDLDGSTLDAGIFSTGALSLDPGTYLIEFSLSGVSPVFTTFEAVQDNIVDVSLGSIFATSYTIAWSAPFETFALELDVDAATVAALVFANQGGDHYGAVLDDVSITAVDGPQPAIPEPATALLVGLGLAGLGRARRRAH